MVFLFRQSLHPYGFVPSPRKTRKKSITRTTKSAYITITTHLRFLYLLDPRSLGITARTAARSRTAYDFADPTLTPLFQRLQNVLGVHARGDKLRAILDHRGENAFSV